MSNTHHKHGDLVIPGDEFNHDDKHFCGKCARVHTRDYKGCDGLRANGEPAAAAPARQPNLVFDPVNGDHLAGAPTPPEVWRDAMPNAAWRVNPWTGARRRAADIESDPLGRLIWEPAWGAPAAAKDADPALPASQRQVGGDHYRKLKIQPMEYSLANKLDAAQHTVIKYVTRFRDKGGIADLEKAKHTIDLLIEHETEASRDR